LGSSGRGANPHSVNSVNIRISRLTTYHPPTKDSVINHSSAITATLYKVQDPNNLGLIYRTAECLGIKKIYTYKCANPNRRVTKGSHQWLKLTYIKSIKHYIQRQHNEGVNIICAKISNKSTPLSKLHFSYPCTIMIGNESHGIPDNISSLCDSIVEIPVYGKTPCLNTAVAFAIFSNESVSQFYKDKDKALYE